MSLKVMCAGCSAEERERTESDVRRGLGARASGDETWIVSVVNLQSRWSITMDGPGIRALNFTAPPGRLAQSIQEALEAKTAATAKPPPAPTASAPPRPPSAPPTSPAPSKPATAPPKPAAAPPPKAAAPPPRPAAPPPLPRVTSVGGPRRDAQACAQCHQRFAVTFDAIAGESEQMSPVACPHCWHTNHVMVGETAADTSDYRAEKA
jgi:hypothetical protein